MFGKPYLGDQANIDKAIIFLWNETREGCDFEKTNGQELQVELSVFDDENQLLGVEVLTYTIEFLGYKVFIDAI